MAKEEEGGEGDPKLARHKEETGGDAAERSDLSERCANLEESLELMRAEFENMEDYWQVRTV